METTTISKKKLSKQTHIPGHFVAPGVWRVKDIFVNVYLVHEPQENKWVLIDAGLKTTGSKIEKLAEQLFWPDTAPAAIILTHGHFDHVGSLRELADKWDVPIYAHELEKPYLTGQSSYPPPDPLVGGGMMSYMSFLYPKGPIDVSDRLIILPRDGGIPVLKGWRYYHTPGHAPGHISLFRESDRLLIAGDAFVTTKNESAICAITQPKIMSGPPKYFTYNWQSAERSVKLLASLEPEIVATGHGQPMSGETMRDLLHELAENFRKQAVPFSGRYVDFPALVNEEGVQSVPPAPKKAMIIAVASIAAVALVGFFLLKKRQRNALMSEILG